MPGEGVPEAAPKRTVVAGRRIGWLGMSKENRGLSGRVELV